MSGINPNKTDLLDREGRGVAELLTRFKNIIELAPVPKDDSSLTTAAMQAFQMEVESTALVSLGGQVGWMDADTC